MREGHRVDFLVHDTFVSTFSVCFVIATAFINHSSFLDERKRNFFESERLFFCFCLKRTCLFLGAISCFPGIHSDLTMSAYLLNTMPTFSVDEFVFTSWKRILCGPSIALKIVDFG